MFQPLGRTVRSMTAVVECANSYRRLGQPSPDIGAHRQCAARRIEQGYCRMLDERALPLNLDQPASDEPGAVQPGNAATQHRPTPFAFAG